MTGRATSRISRRRRCRSPKLIQSVLFVGVFDASVAIVVGVSDPRELGQFAQRQLQISPLDTIVVIGVKREPRFVTD